VGLGGFFRAPTGWSRPDQHKVLSVPLHSRRAHFLLDASQRNLGVLQGGSGDSALFYWLRNSQELVWLADWLRSLCVGASPRIPRRSGCVSSKFSLFLSFAPTRMRDCGDNQDPLARPQVPNARIMIRSKVKPHHEQTPPHTPQPLTGVPAER
jgi:hypothetical protein